MNKIRILLVGLAAISASSLCMAIAAAPPPPVAEKVVSFDTPAPSVSFDVALCDVECLKAPICIEREAVSYVVSESSTAGRSAVTYAKVSAHGRMCGQSVAASLRSQP